MLHLHIFMQSNKHVVVEFERIPSKIEVHYLDVNTEKDIVDPETDTGFEKNKKISLTSHLKI